MARLPGIVLVVAALASAAGPSFAGTGLSPERAGLGLKPPSAPALWTGGLAQRGAAVDAWQTTESAAVVYGGARESARLRPGAIESYTGIYHPLSETLGASMELGVIQGTPLAPRRYSLAGNVHTAFAGGGSLSLGLKYRVYEPDPGARAYGEMPGNGYSLVPARVPGASYAPSYQLNVNYQYSAAHAFALALGRDLDTFTPSFDLPGGPRQFSFTGEHWLTPSWALSYDLLSQDPGAFRFHGLRFGVRYRF